MNLKKVLISLLCFILLFTSTALAFQAGESGKAKGNLSALLKSKEDNLFDMDDILEWLEKRTGKDFDEFLEKILKKHEDRNQKNNEKVSMKASLTTKLKNGKLQMDFSLINNTGRWLPVVFKPGEAYEITVKDAKGRTVYKKSGDYGQGYVELDFLDKKTAIVPLMLKPGANKQLSFSEVWDLRDNSGAEVAPGTYTVSVKVRPVLLEDGKAKEIDVTAAEKKITVKSTKPEKEKLLETRLDTKLEKDSLKMNFSLVNTSSKDIDLYFSSGQKYEIVITNSRGQEVYRWSEGKAFTLALVEAKLAAGKKMEFAESWDLTGKDGKKVPAGKYTVEVRILARPVDGSIVLTEDQLKAKKTVEIKDVKQAQVFDTTLKARVVNDEMVFSFALVNISGKDQEVRFNSGQKYDIVITNNSGREVYRWSEGRFFTEAIEYVTVKKGGSLEFTESWDFKNKNGEIVEPGQYNVKVEIKAQPKEEGQSFSKEEVTAEAKITVPEIKEKKRISTYLSTDLKDGKLHIDCFLFNLTGEDLKLRFNTSQKYDIVVTDANGTEVYRWSDGKTFLQFISYEDLKKAQVLSFSEVWDLKGKSGRKVPGGQYTVRVEMKAFPEDWNDSFSPAELTAEELIRIQ